MGFLGAGTIIIQKQIVKGLTTAAGLWVTAAIGLVVGSGMYEIGIYGTFLTLIVLETFRRISHLLIGHHHTIIFHLKPKNVAAALLALQIMRIRYGFISIVNINDENGLCQLIIDVLLPRHTVTGQLYEELSKIKGVESVEIH